MTNRKYNRRIMSTALLKKSLEIVDPCVIKKTGVKNRKKAKNVLVSESQKYTTNLYTKGYKGEKVNSLTSNSKLSIVEAKKNIKSKEQILKENLEKLELIRKASTVNLDKSITDKIIQRGVTKRPLKPKKKHKKGKKIAFTEEDFKKFEEEYLNE